MHIIPETKLQKQIFWKECQAHVSGLVEKATFPLQHAQPFTFTKELIQRGIRS